MLAEAVLVTTCLLLMAIVAVNGCPLTEVDASNGESLKVQLETQPLDVDSKIVLTVLENKVSDVGFDEDPDDLELAEVNIFRPVFRYRVAVSKKVQGPPQFQ